MCKPKTPKMEAPAPAPAPPPVLEQAAPKIEKDTKTKTKRKGLANYKAPASSGTAGASLGGIPKKGM